MQGSRQKRKGMKDQEPQKKGLGVHKRDRKKRKKQSHQQREGKENVGVRSRVGWLPNLVKFQNHPTLVKRQRGRKEKAQRQREEKRKKEEIKEGKKNVLASKLCNTYFLPSTSTSLFMLISLYTSWQACRYIPCHLFPLIYLKFFHTLKFSRLLMP